MITKALKTAPHPWGRLQYWERSYVSALQTHCSPLVPIDSRGDFLAVVKEQTAEIFDNNTAFIIDLPSQHHLLMESYVLSSYQALLDYAVSNEVAIEVLKKTFCDPGASFIKRLTRIALFTSRDKMKVVMKYGGRKRTAEIYGASFTIEEEGDGDPYFSSNVKRCGYYDFFKNNDAPELTQVFCEWDKLWADVINPRRDGIIFLRASTLASGGDMCKFEFTRCSR